MNTTTRAIAVAVVAAPIAYVMFSAFDPSTRIAVSAILAITAGVFTALFFGSSTQ
jgi:hypothetical protein